MRHSLTTLCLLTLLLASIAPAQAGDSWFDKLEKRVNKTVKGSKAPSVEDIAAAFKQALEIGSANVVKQLGAVDGFWRDPAVRIPLPKDLAKVKKTMDQAGLGKYVKDLELKLNRAAELAAPRGKELFLQAIRSMSFKDVMKIYKGPDNSATLYFQETMSPGLRLAFRPVVDQALKEVDAIRAYQRLVKRYNKLPMVKKINSDVGGHVVERGIDGIFHYLGKEEAAIRKDPVRQTTDLLKRVFGVK